MKNGAIAVLFDRLGPYHWARLQAAARLFRLVAVETHAITHEYQWEQSDKSRAFEKVTLFDDAPASSSRSHALLRRRMTNALHEIDPAVVMIPGWGTPASLIALEWCVQNRRPAVVMSESNAFDKGRYALAELIKRNIVSLFSAGLAGGKLQTEYLITLGLRRDQVFTGYDVVDNEHFARVAARVRSDKEEVRKKYDLPRNYFLASARFVPKKNLRGLIESYALYRSQTESNHWKLVLLGDGPLRRELLTLRDQLDLANDILLPGFIQYPDLPVYYALADVFVHASTKEQWGLVVNEAMATGLPVIVSNRCGCVPDLVAEGKNGFTFDPHSMRSLGKSMLEMSRLPEGRLKEMGMESQRIIGGFTPTHFAKGAQRAIGVAKGTPVRQPSPFLLVLLKALTYR